MPTRALARTNAPRGYAIPTNCPIRVDNSTNGVKIIPAGTGSTEVELLQTITVGATGSLKLAAGTGALVSGAATIATGLSNILGYSVDGGGNPSGATAAASPQLLTAVATTGSLAVTAYAVTSVTGAVTASTGATGSFSWFAFGT